MEALSLLDGPPDERPRERCLNQSARCLSLRECLALILGSGPPGQGCLGLAGAVLGRPGSGLAARDEEAAFFTALEASSPALLQGIPGLGDAGKARLLAAFEVGRRYAGHRERMARPRAGPRAGRLDFAEKALEKIPDAWRGESQEWLGFVPLYRSGELGELCLVEKGVRTHVNVEPAELFARVLALRPRAFFLFHNHPSGDLTPSGPDYELTRRAGGLAADLGLRLLGHGIVSSRGERWIVL